MVRQCLFVVFIVLLLLVGCSPKPDQVAMIDALIDCNTSVEYDHAKMLDALDRHGDRYMEAVNRVLTTCLGVKESQASVPTPTPTLTTTATPGGRVLPTPRPNHFGISRDQVYRKFQDLNIGLIPLDRHTNDWYSTRLRDGSIDIDILGPSSGVQAIESAFRLSPEVLAKMDPVVNTMLQIAMGDNWQDGVEWITEALERLSASHKKVQDKMGRIYLTLYLIPSIQSVMFSVDMERQ